MKMLLTTSTLRMIWLLFYRESWSSCLISPSHQRMQKNKKTKKKALRRFQSQHPIVEPFWWSEPPLLPPWQLSCLLEIYHKEFAMIFRALRSLVLFSLSAEMQDVPAPFLGLSSPGSLFLDCDAFYSWIYLARSYRQLEPPEPLSTLVSFPSQPLKKWGLFPLFHNRDVVH